MERPNPKFSPGEPAIVETPYSPECNGTRVIIVRAIWDWREDFTMGWGYETLPPPPGGFIAWAETALRPLPPEELAGCFDTEEEPWMEQIKKATWTAKIIHGAIPAPPGYEELSDKA